MNDWIHRLVEKIQHLDCRMTDVRAGRPLAPWDDRFRLNPPLSLQELETLESRYKVALPEEYRDFLLEAGNGGAGLKPFGCAPYPDDEWNSMSFLSRDPEGLARPFPLVESVLFDDEIAENLPSDVDFWSQACDLRWQEGGYPWDGAFFLHDYGCAIVVLLVFTGPERGNIWIDDRGNDFGICKIRDHWSAKRLPVQFGATCSFRQWFEAYLDNQLSWVEAGAWPDYIYDPESGNDPFLEPAELSCERI